MKCTIRGCRGSVAVSGERFVRYGGNTTCFEITTADARLIVDAGCGVAQLGRTEPWDDLPTLMFFTHFHSDHITGFPHFLPLFLPDTKLTIAGVPRDDTTVHDALIQRHRPPYFPLHLETGVRATVVSKDLAPRGVMDHGSLSLSWLEIAHPGGASGLRIECGDSSIVILTDVELRLGDREALLEFASGADVLLCDAQYTEDEYPSRQGWGHSTNIDAAAFAADAGVRELLLVHHDPTRSDDQIDELVNEAKTRFNATSGGAQHHTFVLPG